MGGRDEYARIPNRDARGTHVSCCRRNAGAERGLAEGLLYLFQRYAAADGLWSDNHVREGVRHWDDQCNVQPADNRPV